MSRIAVPLAQPCPLTAFAPHAEAPFALLLDSAAETAGRGRYSYLCLRPRAVLTEGRGAFQALARLLPRQEPLPGLPPFQGGLAGFLGYDLGREVERLPEHQPDDLALPPLAMGLFDCIAAWDHAAGRAWVIGPEAVARALAADLEAAPPLPPLDWSATARFTAEQEADSYRAAIARVLAYIHAGDIFQANLSQRFSAPLPAGLSAFMLYRRLRHLAPAPFAACLSLGPDTALLSASPERFLAVDGAGGVETRPIKGTRPRGADAAADAALAADLAASAKDRAENLMIVDLMRNDLARVCRPGSVRVPELFTVERFSTVHHLVSAVSGQLAQGAGPLDLLRACFPGGSITGAPKVRAMEIIAELEPRRRGPVFGSLAWIGGDGRMDSNIAIRTLTVTRGRVMARAGGGIVADSDPQAEYEETLVKARAMIASLEGPS
ncbi:aminodeoxychorismate synthase component 1 [mine drainage metagenome]|uniref:aminodeoxychorismate synthase n=1 Tax=mine drainage metagenome TaxID=410659 RepID=A0A1J5SKP6_9ZZZZ